MSTQHRLLLLMGACALAAALVVLLGRWSMPAYANVTLISFTASPVPETSEIQVEWKTATEFGTYGFFVTRSDRAAGPYARASYFFTPTGDTIVGGSYVFTDLITLTNHTYWYLLEEITGEGSNFYGPISATLTITQTPTATPTSQPATKVAKPTASPTLLEATPQPATGATITPLPASSGGTTNPEAFAATPTNAFRVQESQPVVTTATSMTSAPGASTAAASARPPVAVDAAHLAVPVLSPTAAVPEAAEPVVIVTETPSPTSASGTGSGPALLLIAAAILFLGLAFVILRQARQ